MTGDQTVGPVATTSQSSTPAPTITNQPVLSQRGQVRAFAVAECAPQLNASCLRCRDDETSQNCGWGFAYVSSIVGTGVGILCGLYLAPPLFSVAACSATLGGVAGATQLGCCVHHYLQVRREVRGVMQPNADDTFLIAQDDIQRMIDSGLVSEPEETDGSAAILPVVNLPPSPSLMTQYTRLQESPPVSVPDVRFQEARDVAQLVNAQLATDPISSEDMPGDPEGLIIHNDPSALTRTMPPTHVMTHFRDYEVIDHPLVQSV